MVRAAGEEEKDKKKSRHTCFCATLLMKKHEPF